MGRGWRRTEAEYNSPTTIGSWLRESPSALFGGRRNSRRKISCIGTWQVYRFSEDATPVVKFIVESRDDGERRSSFDLLALEATWDWKLVRYLTSIDHGDAYAFEREGGK